MCGGLAYIYLCNIFYIYTKEKIYWGGGEGWIKSLGIVITVMVFFNLFRELRCLYVGLCTQYYIRYAK